MSNLTLEQVKTIYFDADALRLPDYYMGRLQSSDGRLYYRYGYADEQSVELFTSLTTVIYQCTPMPYQLLEWYTKLGMEEAKRYSNMKAMYGTLMHIEIGKFCQEQVYDFDKCEEVVNNYLSENDFWQPECKDWKYNLKDDMIAWSQFVFDTRMKCLAVEMVLCSSKGYATAIDIVADVDLPVKGFHGEVYKTGDRKGEAKETTVNVRKRVVINMKSGRHGFFESNGIQIAAEKMLFEENFPDIKIDAMLNWAPADWRTADGKKYKIKDWTGCVDERELNAMFQLAEVKFRDKMQEKERMNIYGQVMYGNDPKANISVEKLIDMVRRIEKRKSNPDYANNAELVIEQV